MEVTTVQGMSGHTKQRQKACEKAIVVNSMHSETLSLHTLLERFSSENSVTVIPEWQHPAPHTRLYWSVVASTS